MTNVFIFHGTGGYPEENWFPWLKRELELLGYKVIVPQFPTPKDQSYENWVKVLEPFIGLINSETIFIGHSLGGSFLLRLLENYNLKIKAAFLVAAPIGILPIKNYDADKLFLGEFKFNWQKIKRRCQHFFVFHSDNDPYVSLGNGEELARNLGTELIFIPKSGHFNAKAGYLKFDELLDKIKKIV